MLLIIVLILVTIMAFMGIARAFFSRGVTSQVLRSSLGIQAQTIAESAAVEALVDLRARVNDPGDPLYEELRREVYAGGESQFELGLETPQLDKMYGEYPEIAAFYLHERTAQVRFQRQFTKAPYERFGLIQVKATVRRDLSLTRHVSRTVELGAEFKVHLLNTPRPFDQTAVYVHGGTDLLRRAYQRLEDVLQNIEFRRSEHEDLTDRLSGRRDAVPFNGPSMLSRYEGMVVPEAAYWREKAPLLKEPGAIFAMGRAPDGIDLAHLQIDEKIREAADEVEKAEAALEAARSELDDDFENVQRHNEYLARLRRTLGTYSELFGRMETFRKLFHVWDGAKFGQLEPFGYKISPGDWRRKATYVLDRDPEGRSPQAVFDRFLQQKDGAFGVFYSNWPSKTINLTNRKIKGRVVLVVENTALNLTNVEAAGPEDLLTVVSFGTLNIRGKVGASVLALGSTTIEPGTEILGNLVFDELKNPRALAGRVEHDPKHYSGRTTKDDVSGAKTQYYWVTVAPRPVYRSILGGKS